MCSSICSIVPKKIENKIKNGSGISLKKGINANLNKKIKKLPI